MLSSGIRRGISAGDFGHYHQNVKVYIKNENVYTGVNQELIAKNATPGRINS
jgi:hypothetical protein